jgi:hypothetical protein
MCVRCGTGRVARCTDPYRHGESTEPVMPGRPPAPAPITWHLDPTVWKTARLGMCSAEMWCVEIGGETGWAVFGPGPGLARCQNTEPTPEQAQERAETALRVAHEETS